MYRYYILKIFKIGLIAKDFFIYFLGGGLLIFFDYNIYLNNTDFNVNLLIRKNPFTLRYPFLII